MTDIPRSSRNSNGHLGAAGVFRGCIYFDVFSRDSLDDARAEAEACLILLMEEILHQLIGSLPHYLQGFVVQDFFHQQYHIL